MRTQAPTKRVTLLACFLFALTVAGGAPQHAVANVPRNADASWAAALQVPSTQRAALQLARRAATVYLTKRTILPVPRDLPPALRRRGAVFATVEKQGQITPRGCRGTLRPTYHSLAEEIIRNTVAACIRDRNQPPLRVAELPRCRISLTVVTAMQPIQNIAQHDAENNGLVAQSGSAIGIVLPYEGRDAATQLKWAKRKAGLPDNARVQLSELYAVRFRE